MPLQRDHDVRKCVTPPSKDDSTRIKKQRYPQDVEKLMLRGVVWKCSIHKIAVSQSPQKYKNYNDATHLLPVVVHSGHLGNTLIPINEGEAKPKGRK